MKFAILTIFFSNLKYGLVVLILSTMLGKHHPYLFPNVFKIPTGILYHSTINPISPSSQFLVTSNLLSVSRNFPILSTSCRRNYTTLVLLCLTHVVLHCMYLLYFIYPFICSLTLELLPSFDWCE